MAKSKKTSDKKETKETTIPGFAVKATDPLAERLAAIYLSMLQDAGETDKAKEVRKAHGKIKDYQAQ